MSESVPIFYIGHSIAGCSFQFNFKRKEEKQAGRISIKEKLAEKKAVIEQRDKSDKEVPEKGTEKKSEREI